VNLGNLFADIYKNATDEKNGDQSTVDRAAQELVKQYETALKLHEEGHFTEPIPAFVYRHLGVIQVEYFQDFEKARTYLKKFLAAPNVAENSRKEVERILEYAERSRIQQTIVQINDWSLPEKEGKVLTEEIEEAVTVLKEGLVQFKEAEDDITFWIGKAVKLLGKDKEVK
jgi:hypothetical protein